MALFLKGKTQRDILALFTANIFYKFTGYLIVIILAKYLGKENLGKFFFAFSFTGLFIIFSELGINPFLTRLISRDKSTTPLYMSNILGLRIILSLFCFLIAILIAFFIQRSLFIIILLASLFTLTESLYSSLSSLFLAYKKVKYNIMCGIPSKILLIFLVLLIVNLRPNLANIFWAHIIGSGFMLLLAIFITYTQIARINLSFEPEVYKQIIKGSLPFAFLTIIGIIFYRIDSVMLGMMKSYTEVGIYGAGYKLREAILFIPNSIAMILYPQMAELYTRPRELKKLYIRSIKWLIIPGIVITAGALFFTRKIVLTIYGPAFLSSAEILKILYLTVPVMFTNIVSITLLKATNKEYPLLFVTAGCLLFKILINFLLIPAYSYIGTAISTIFIDITLFGILIFCINIFMFKSENL